MSLRPARHLCGQRQFFKFLSLNVSDALKNEGRVHLDRFKVRYLFEKGGQFNNQWVATASGMEAEPTSLSLPSCFLETIVALLLLLLIIWLLLLVLITPDCQFIKLYYITIINFPAAVGDVIG